MKQRPTFLALYIDKKTGKPILEMELKPEEAKLLLKQNGEVTESDDVKRIIFRKEDDHP